MAQFARTFSTLERDSRGLGALSEYAELAASQQVETLVDMDDLDDREKVIALAEWVGKKVDANGG